VSTLCTTTYELEIRFARLTGLAVNIQRFGLTQKCHSERSRLAHLPLLPPAKDEVSLSQLSLLDLSRNAGQLSFAATTCGLMLENISVNSLRF
jgi:hypothetical protein